MGLPCRCHAVINGRRCDTRRSLAQHPNRYSATRYIPRCPSCGARKWYVDKWRLKHEVRGNGDTCGCGGYWFWHRKGSKWCEHNPRWEELHDEQRQ